MLINTFLPSVLKIRAGDTVTWKINSDEPHTATFLSGGERPAGPGSDAGRGTYRCDAQSPDFLLYAGSGRTGGNL